MIVIDPVQDIIITDTQILDTGVVFAHGRDNFFYFDENKTPITKIAGIRLSDGRDPKHNDYIRIANTRIENSSKYLGLMTYGILNEFSASVHNIIGNNKISGYSAARTVNVSQGPIPLTQVTAEYEKIFGCKGEPLKMIRFWDNTVSFPDGSPAWSLDVLRAQLQNLKNRNISQCL
jgi:hypothetical protein